MCVFKVPVCVLGGSGNKTCLSTDDSTILQWWLWGNPTVCFDLYWLLCPQLSRLKQELAQMRQELQYKEMGVETLQEWVKLNPSSHVKSLEKFSNRKFCHHNPALMSPPIRASLEHLGLAECRRCCLSNNDGIYEDQSFKRSPYDSRVVPSFIPSLLKPYDMFVGSTDWNWSWYSLKSCLGNTAWQLRLFTFINGKEQF